jgi:hypothetical protein
MRLGKRLFPYPIINNQKTLSGYERSDFSFECQPIQHNGQLTLKDAHFITNNETLLNLYDQKKVNIVCIVECSATVYRKVFNLEAQPKDIDIPISDLREKVVVSAFAYAMTDIPDFDDSDFSEAYSGLKFFIDQYDILAADDGFTTRIKYDEKEDDKVSSIFLVLKDTMNDDELVRINPTSKKINIHLREGIYDYYFAMKHLDYIEPIIFSILIVPALMYAIHQAQKDGLENARQEYDWFNAIEKRYEDLFSKDITEDSFEEISSVELAQKLIGLPIHGAIDSLFQMSLTNGDEGEQDE